MQGAMGPAGALDSELLCHQSVFILSRPGEQRIEATSRNSVDVKRPIHRDDAKLTAEGYEVLFAAVVLARSVVVRPHFAIATPTRDLWEDRRRETHCLLNCAQQRKDNIILEKSNSLRGRTAWHGDVPHAVTKMRDVRSVCDARPPERQSKHDCKTSSRAVIGIRSPSRELDPAIVVVSV